MTEISKKLPAVPSTVFLFGLAGAGKSYVGDLIGQWLDGFVYHADDDLTADMKLALKQNQPFTEPMRDNFFDIVTKKILYLQKKHKMLVVTQAAYKQRHREYLLSQIPDMDMILIDSHDVLIRQRINDRRNGISQQSAAALRQDFEPPEAHVKQIINDGDSCRIKLQLEQLYSISINN